MESVGPLAPSLKGNEADADDLVQETFLPGLKAWHTFRPERKP